MKPMGVTGPGFNHLVVHRFFSNRDDDESCVFNFFFITTKSLLIFLLWD